MKATLTEMHSIRDAIRTLYMSKRSWTRDKEQYIDELVEKSTDRYGRPLPDAPKEFWKEVEKLFKYGQKHITMLRFLDMSVIVEDLHRGATDDFDSHAKRLENRIIRSSTRLADYDSDELSEWYEDKIMPTDVALRYLGIKIPEKITTEEGTVFCRTTNGYVAEAYRNNRDAKRGLYMLAIPMTFTFKVNIVEFAHIYKERGAKFGGANGTAAPELQLMIEELTSQLLEWYPIIDRKYLLDIIN